jgi:hypothetical protein
MSQRRLAVATLVLAAAVAHAQYGPNEVPQPPAAGEPRQREGAAVQERPGKVSSLDRASGRLVVTTADGPLTLYLPVEQVSGLRQGDEVTVRVALLPGPKGTETKGAGSFATDPETGSPGARPPASGR